MAKRQGKTRAGRRTPATSGKGFSILDTGVGTEMGASAPKKWKAKYVQYYKLGFSVDKQNNLSFTFSPGCGFRALQTPSDLDKFILDFKQGAPSVTRFGTLGPGPHFTLYDNGYVAIELDGGNWRFMRDHAGITIGTNHTPNAKPDKAYFSLEHFDEQGNSTGRHAPPLGTSSRKMYFGVNPRKKNAPNPKMDVDRFNLYFELDQGGDALPLILDPDIKNEGGSNPAIDSPQVAAGARLAKKR